MNDLERAIDIALDAYAGQTDKAGATYIRHPLRVMERMETERGRVVAVLHDVVEDADYSLADIEAAFDTEVRDAVAALTKRDGESYDEFAERAAANPLARNVKIADIEDNMDLTRLDEVDESVLAKQAEYHAAWLRLTDESNR
jgi:(p)ppGpp synthase/HD superfamily hydrolase